jgi:hypothetical protein
MEALHQARGEQGKGKRIALKYQLQLTGIA